MVPVSRGSFIWALPGGCFFEVCYMLLCGRGLFRVGVLLAGEALLCLFLVLLPPLKVRRYGTVGVRCSGRASRFSSEGGVGKRIISSGKRVLVKTAMGIGKRPSKAVAGTRNRFSLMMRRSTILRVSFIKYRAGRIPMQKRARFRVLLGRSTIVLSPIVIATLNVRGGRSSLSCSTVRLGDSRLGQIGSPGVVATLTKGTTNIRVDGGSSKPNTSTGIDVHNVHSMIDSGRPLCMVSNIPVLGSASRRTCSTVKNATGTNGHSKNSNVSGLGPRSIRDVAVLGNTPTTTLCNDRTTGKMVLVAAGGKDRSKIRGMSFSADLAISGTFDLPRVRGHCKIDSSMSD